MAGLNRMRGYFSAGREKTNPRRLALEPIRGVHPRTTDSFDDHRTCHTSSEWQKEAFSFLPSRRPRLIKIGLSSLTLGTSSISTVVYSCPLNCLGNEDDNEGGNGGRFRRFRVSDDESRGTVSKCRDTSMEVKACPPLICSRMLLC